MPIEQINVRARNAFALAHTLVDHFKFTLLSPARTCSSAAEDADEYQIALLDGGDLLIVITQDPHEHGLLPGSKRSYLGLSVDSEPAVLDKHLELLDAGFDVGPVIGTDRQQGSKWLGFYCWLGRDLTMQVSCHLRPNVAELPS